MQNWQQMLHGTPSETQKVHTICIANFARSRQPLVSGEAHTNIPLDLLMEHENKEAKEDIASARGLSSCRIFATI